MRRPHPRLGRLDPPQEGGGIAQGTALEKHLPFPGVTIHATQAYHRMKRTRAIGRRRIRRRRGNGAAARAAACVGRTARRQGRRRQRH